LPAREDKERRRRLPPGVKRDQILQVAAEHFGRNGYDDTKWADVATVVGIGSTALYHYFESKQHSLYEIMARSVASFQARFDGIVSTHDDFRDAIVAVLVDSFDLTESEVLQLRVVAAEQGLVAVPSKSPREEEARLDARSRMRDLEFAWGIFLTRGMEQGAIPKTDPKLLARSVLGLYNSVWHWYRPGGPVSLADVSRFFIARQLTVLGLSPELAAQAWAEKSAR
jgi:TetR/AcrR family transcriptional regulator, cholesterol catabolism regulator